MIINYYTKDLYNDVIFCLKNKYPLFMLRMGDGEMIIANNHEGSMSFFSKKQIGRLMTQDEIELTKKNLIESVLNCTILGLPTKSHVKASSLWEELFEYYDKIKNENFNDWNKKKYCNINFNYDILIDETLFNILKETENLVIVSPRNLVDKLKLKFPNIKNIEYYDVPGEQAYEEIKNSNKNIFDEIKIISEKIKSKNRKGEILIFGVGPFGKILGSDFYKMGGISLDLGSTFDMLAGKVTRGVGKGANSYVKPLI